MVNYKKLIKIMRETNKNAVMIDGYDSCIVGICETNSNTIFLYSIEKILAMLIKEMPEQEAMDYIYYKIINQHYGEHSPVFLAYIK